MKWFVAKLILWTYLNEFETQVSAASMGDFHSYTQQIDTEHINKMVYLNATVFQDSPGHRNYTLSISIVPVSSSEREKLVQGAGADIEKSYQFDDVVDRTSTPPPGGLIGAIESFLKVIPAFPGAVVETVGTLAGGVPELLGINVTHIWNTTLVGVRKNPVRTAVTAINNVAFCNPLFAGVNAGRCKGFFMAT